MENFIFCAVRYMWNNGGISGIFSLFKNIFSKDKQLEVFFVFCNLLAIIW